MHHIIVVNKRKNRFKKKQSKGNFSLASQFVWLKPYRERLGNNKGELQKENISKRSILINIIKRFMKTFHTNTLTTMLSHLN